MTNPPGSFSRQQRLVHSTDFNQAMREAEWKGHSRAIRMLVRRNHLDGARLGIVAPKRFVRMAHDRNALKRIIRETYRRSWFKLPAVDMVVMIGPGCERANLAESLLVLFDELRKKRPTWFPE